MYSELQYQIVRDKSAEYKRLISRWNGRARDMLIGLGATVLVYLAIGVIHIFAPFHPLVIIFASVVTTLWLGSHMYCKHKATKYHAKRVIAEAYLMRHEHDYKNIDNAPHKEN